MFELLCTRCQLRQECGTIVLAKTMNRRLTYKELTGKVDTPAVQA